MLGRESVNMTIYLYAQTMGLPRMLYIRKFYVVKNIFICIYIHRWDTGTQLQWRVTNMARNDLRARGAVGVALRATPTASIYIKISCPCVCVSSDVMFVCRLTSCFRLTKLQTGTSGNE